MSRRRLAFTVIGMLLSASADAQQSSSTTETTRTELSLSMGSGGGGGGNGSFNNSGPGGLNQNLPLQTPQKVFRQSLPRLVNDVRAIVGLPPLSVGADGNLIDPMLQNQNPSILDADSALYAIQRERESGAESGASVGNTSSSFGGGGSSGQPATISPLYMPPERPQVIYNSDQNFLWVVATRRQHEWVAEYLSKVDKPQPLIAIEVKFLETKKNPQTDIGVNWENTFGSGLTVGGQASIGSTDGEIGSIGFQNSRQRGENRGNLTASFDGQGNTTFATAPVGTVDNNLSGSSISGNIPYSAVLSLEQFSFTLQAFMQDRDTSIVQYPRVLTLNNDEVAITSAEYTPLNVGTSTAVSQTGTAGTTVGSLQYLPTGTQINILPKVVNSDQIAMTVAITVSSVVGELPLNLGTGVNLYPITSSRVYNASLQVDSGYTLAVGGLEKVDDRNVQGGVPVLKDIPGLGYFFKNINKKRDKLNLIIFLTPYIISDPAQTPGVSETPQSILPLRPGVPPEAPAFTPNGQLIGGESAVDSAFVWLDFQLNYFRQVNLESMMTRDSIRRLKDVIAVGRTLLANLQLAAGPPPFDPDSMASRNTFRAEELLTDLNRALAVAQDNLM